MTPIALVLAAASLAPSSQAPLGRGGSPWHLGTYAAQLGSQHFPAGGAAFDDGIAAVESLPSGAVVVAGWTYGSLGEAHAGSSNVADAFLARFDPAGQLEWVRQIGAVTGPTIPAIDGNPSGPGGDATASDFANDIAVLPDGSILMTGGTSGSLGETNGGSTDVFLAKFDAAGALLWLRQLGAETAQTLVPEPGATHFRDPSSFDYGVSIASYADGGAVVGGITGSDLTEECTSGENFVLFRYDAVGQLAWVRQMGSTSAPRIGYGPTLYLEFGQIALHPSGRIVLAGFSWSAVGTLYSQKPVLMTFDAAGVPLEWVTVAGFTTSFYGVQVHAPTGRILVAGAHRVATEYTDQADIMVASYDASLALEWTTVIDAALAAELGLGDVSMSGEVATSLRLDPLGNLVVAGITSGTLDEPYGGVNDIFTARFRGTDGKVLSVSQLGRTTARSGFDTSKDDRVGRRGLALGPAGTILVGGSTTGDFGESLGGGTDALLLRLDTHGKL